MVFPSEWDGNGMGWDGNLYFCPTTSFHPITITQLSDTSTIPYYFPQLLPYHPTHHDKTSYHPIRIMSVPCTYQHNSRNILTDVQDLLKILVQDFQKRGLGRALDDVEKIVLLPGPRFKSLCTAVRLNGGNDLQNKVRALVGYKFLSFSGNVTFSAGSVGTGSSRDGQGAGGPQAGEAPVPALSRMGNIRANMNKVARPAGDVDAPELRKDAALREMAEYMKEATPKNDSKINFLQYWEARGTDGVDPSGKVVVPARWPHIGLLARFMQASIPRVVKLRGTFPPLSRSLVICAPVLWLTKQRRCCCPGSTGILFPDLRG